MITGTQKEIERLLPFVTGRLKHALELVAKLDLTKLPVGKTPLDGETIFASTNVYQTEPRENRRPEKHFTHMDIQLVVEGRETIGVTDVENVSDLTEDRREKDDIVFMATRKKKTLFSCKRGLCDFLSLGSPSAQLLFCPATGNGEKSGCESPCKNVKSHG